MEFETNTPQIHLPTFFSNYQMEGELIDIIRYPDPILTKKALPIDDFGDDLEKLCKDMLYTMYQSPGIGLAAPQINQSIRLFVADVDFERELGTQASGEKVYHYKNFNPYIFINPKIVEKSGEILYEEGCLSLPGVYENVKRFDTITVEYLDFEGQKHSLQAKDLLSICIQHELDHLDGIVFIDYLSAFKKTFYKKRLIKEKKNL